MKRLSLVLLMVTVLILGIAPYVAHTAVGSWSTNGPALTRGGNGIAVYSIAFSPQYSSYNKIFTSAENGYLHISYIENGEVKWRTVDCNQLIGSNFWQLTALAVTPDNTVFVATSNGSYSTYLRSSDGGNTWQALSDLPGSAHWSFAVSPNYMEDKTIFLVGNHEILKSTDGGLTWNAKSNGALCSTIAISPNFKTDGTVFAGGVVGMFRSTDYGETWVRIDNGLGAGGANPPYPDITSVVVSPDFANDNSLFVQDYTKGVYKSTNRGDSWTCVNDTVYYGDLAISPNYVNDGMIAVTKNTNVGQVVVISRDRGLSWNEQLPKPLIAIAPKISYN